LGRKAEELDEGSGKIFDFDDDQGSATLRAPLGFTHLVVASGGTWPERRSGSCSKRGCPGGIWIHGSGASLQPMGTGV
jgi:hypothetical protein